MKRRDLRVRFDDALVDRARRVGAARQAFHDERGTSNAYGLAVADSMKVNVQGALAELIVALVIDREDEWVECTADYKGLHGDVAGVEVRSTRNASGGLILHPRDPDNAPFVLVRFIGGGYAVLAGWLLAHEGKDERWWPGPHAHRPCFYVPGDRLRYFDVDAVLDAAGRWSR